MAILGRLLGATWLELPVKIDMEGSHRQTFGYVVV